MHRVAGAVSRSVPQELGAAPLPLREAMLKLIHIMLSTIQDPVVPVPPPSYTAAMNALPGGDLVETGIRDLEAGVE